MDAAYQGYPRSSDPMKQLWKIRKSISDEEASSPFQDGIYPRVYGDPTTIPRSQQSSGAETTGCKGPWIELFIYGQEVEQAISQFNRLNTNDFPRWPDEYEMNSSLWYVILQHLQDAADRIRGLIKLLHEWIDRHEFSKAIERLKMDPNNFRKADGIVVRSYQQYIFQDFHHLKHRYRRLVFGSTKRDSRHFQKVEVITGKMYLWSRIEAMTTEYLQEVNKLDNEIYERAKERLNGAVPEFWTIDDLI